MDEASQWATAYQVRELFVTFLMYCQVIEPYILCQSVLVRTYHIICEQVSIRGDAFNGERSATYYFD